ncbi:MAG: hypothetical protein WBA90_02620 [Albidovulum sp.]
MSEKRIAKLSNEQAWVLRAMAQEPDILCSLYPRGIAVPDALAGDWETAFVDAWSKDDYEHNDDIKAIDALLESISGQQNIEYWKTSALSQEPIWDELRSRSRHALTLRGMSLLAPDVTQSTYVVDGEVHEPPFDQS